MASDEQSQPPRASGLGGEQYVFPVSSPQERLWFIEQLVPGNSAFNLPIPFRIRGPLSLEILQRTFDEMVRRHESLRTTFTFADDKVVQVIHAEGRAWMENIDLGALPAEAREPEARKLLRAEVQKPFDLVGGPLLKIVTYRLANDDWFLLVHLHHMVGDGWSFRIITDEFSHIYTAFAAGRPSSLEELTLQYGDFAHWQREWYETDEFRAELKFWIDRLQDAPPTIPVPTDFPHLPNRRFTGATELIFLPDELVQRMRAYCAKEGVTMFMLTLAVFHVMLQRYTGSSDIVLGTPIANRTRPELESVIGYFVNNLVLRTSFDPAQPFRTLLQTVRDSTLEAFEHQDVPLEQIVEALNPDRTTGRNPIYQLLFSCQKAFIETPVIPGLELQHAFFDRSGSAMEMWFGLIEREEGMRITVEYSTELFRRETVLRMAGHYRQLLTAVVEQPEAPTVQLTMLPAAERAQIVDEWNRTTRDYPRDVCLHELFEQQARRAPNAIALVFSEQSLTYGELDQRADALAALLRTQGVGPDVLVGLCVERGFEMVAGILGILKAGGAYVPIDPAYPADRIAFVLEDSQAPVLITQRSLVSSLPASAAFRVFLDEPLPPVAANAVASTAKAGPTNLAYVLFTSGSTGKPKGVPIEHRAVVNFLNSMRREPGLVADDVLLAVTTLSFDIAGLELHLPLTTGARIVIAPWEVAADGEALLATIARHGITMLQATPATWRLMLAAGWKGTPRLKALCGGEAMPADLAEQLIPRCAEVWNMYGPTETTIWSTCSRVTDAKDIHIGRPIDNTEIFILDAHQQPLPVTLAGELLIGGDGLARGYLHRPEMTADRFVPHPFKPGQRLYRTGDLARYRTDGNIDCLGRLDFQVKIRGFRIELGEIETQLATHPHIKQAVVTAREDTPGDKRLVAYFISTQDPAPDAAHLREHLRGKLPEYMVPAAFVPMRTLPLTPNGKIDRKALPKPEGLSAAAPKRDAIAPRTNEEKRLAGLFEKLLGAPVPSVTDSFFDLGGHSLMAAKLMVAVEREFGTRIPLARLFDAPTVEKLAALLTTPVDPEAAWPSLVPIRAQEGKPRLFLVHGAGGNVLLYRELAQGLAPEVSVYGFQSQGLDRKTTPLARVEDMAAHYVRELRAFQPAGPYHIGGYCMGGSVAYEMARLLELAGQKVGVVALLDTYNMSLVKRSAEKGGRFSFLRQKVGFHLNNLTQLGAKDLFGYLGEKLRMAEEAGKGKIAASLKSLKNAVGGSVEEEGAEVFIQEINHEAGWAYVPVPFAGRITVFRPQKNYDFFPDPKMGWAELVGDGLDVVALPINPHAMLIDPFAAKLALEVRQRIAQYPLPGDSRPAADPAPALAGTTR